MRISPVALIPMAFSSCFAVEGRLPPEQAHRTALVSWGQEAFGGWRCFTFGDESRQYLHVSRCRTSGLPSSEDAVYESIGDEVWRLRVYRPSIVGERRFMIGSGGSLFAIVIAMDGTVVLEKDKDFQVVGQVENDR
jgi:hypothetical protein